MYILECQLLIAWSLEAIDSLISNWVKCDIKINLNLNLNHKWQSFLCLTHWLTWRKFRYSHGCWDVKLQWFPIALEIVHFLCCVAKQKKVHFRLATNRLFPIYSAAIILYDRSDSGVPSTEMFNFNQALSTAKKLPRLPTSVMFRVFVTASIFYCGISEQDQCESWIYFCIWTLQWYSLSDIWSHLVQTGDFPCFWAHDRSAAWSDSGLLSCWQNAAI